MENFINLLMVLATMSVWIAVVMKNNSTVQLILLGVHLIFSMILCLYLKDSNMAASLIWLVNAVLGGMLFTYKLTQIKKL